MSRAQVKSPQVAIITRTKNRNNFLKRAIESVQAQTYTDYIQVIVNDGGDKGAVEGIVDALPQSFRKRIKLLHNNQSLGHTPALNQGIKSVKSKYVAILDDDDSWAPDYLKQTVGFLERTGSPGVVAVMDRIIERVLDNGTIEFISKDRWHPEVKYVSLFEQCIDNYMPTVTFVYRRRVFDELGGYDETLGVAEDWDFSIRFLLKYDVDFLNTPDALSFYHHRPEASGSAGNSVFFGVDQHQYYQNLLANRYLRNDIKEGKLGIGYIVNSLKHERKMLELENRLRDAQTVRIEGHMNFVGREIERFIDDKFAAIVSKIKKYTALGLLRNGVNKVRRQQ